MIKITESINGFTVEGHANYAPHGNDIVCAGVSTLAQAVANTLNLMFDAKVTIKQGFLEVYHPEYVYSDSEVTLVASVFWIGVEELAEQYPNHIQIDRNPF